jgi:hypothetical protein
VRACVRVGVCVWLCVCVRVCACVLCVDERIWILVGWESDLRKARDDCFFFRFASLTAASYVIVIAV